MTAWHLQIARRNHKSSNETGQTATSYHENRMKRVNTDMSKPYAWNQIFNLCTHKVFVEKPRCVNSVLMHLFLLKNQLFIQLMKHFLQHRRGIRFSLA